MCTVSLSQSRLIYNLGLAKIDPGYKRLEAAPLGISKNILDLDYPEEPFFQKMIVKPAGIGYVAAMNVIDDKSDWYVGIALHRSPESSVFDKESLDLFQCLFPHFQRSLKIQREFSRLRMKESTLMQGLSHIPFGIIVLDESDQTEYTNHVAQQILTHHSAISSTPKGISAYYHEQNLDLQNAITEIARSEIDTSERPLKSLGLTHQDNELPLAVMLMPLRNSGMEELTKINSGKVLMIISDHEHSTSQSPDALQNVFKLTNTEARVTIALTNGLTVEQVATLNNVKPSTVKSHIKSIFGKTGVNRQQDLIRLVLSGPYSVNRL